MFVQLDEGQGSGVMVNLSLVASIERTDSNYANFTFKSACGEILGKHRIAKADVGSDAVLREIRSYGREMTGAFNQLDQ